MASDKEALRDQVALNIRERAGRRKQKPVTRPESRSKRIRCLFGIRGRLGHCRGLEGRYRLAELRPLDSVLLNGVRRWRVSQQPDADTPRSRAVLVGTKFVCDVLAQSPSGCRKFTTQDVGGPAWSRFGSVNGRQHSSDEIEEPHQ